MGISKSALQRRYKLEHDRYERAAQNLLSVLNWLLADLAPQHRIRPVPIVQACVKEFDSFYAKALRLAGEGRVACVEDCMREIGDLARARLVCQTVDDSERLVGLISEQQAHLLYNGVESETHSHTESTGYRATHLKLEVDVQVGGRTLATPCELQIVTALQYAWGLYTHDHFYKASSPPATLVGTLMRELSDLLHVADRFAGHLIREAEAAQTAGR